MTNILNLLYRDNSLSRNLEILLLNSGKWMVFPEILKQAQEHKFAKGVAASERGVRIALTRVKHFVGDETGYNWRHAEVTPENTPSETPVGFAWNKAGAVNKGGWRGKVPTDARDFYHKSLDRDGLRGDVVDRAREAYIAFLVDELPGVSSDVIRAALVRSEAIADEAEVVEGDTTE